MLRTFLMAVGSFAFVVAGAAISLAAFSGIAGVLRGGGVLVVVIALVTTTLYAAVGVVAVLFFGYGFVLFSTRLVSRVFGGGVLLEFGPDGMIDRASAVSVGFVSWGEVGRISLSSVGGQRFLVLKVRDSGAMLRRMNPVKRAIVRFNRRRYTGGEVTIPLSHVGLTEEEILHEIETRMEKFEARNG